jgi:hypothetical protein
MFGYLGPSLGPAANAKLLAAVKVTAAASVKRLLFIGVLPVSTSPIR